MTRDIIDAVWHDWKTVRTRDSLQLIFEVPIEAQNDVLTLLGPPMSSASVHVAIARLREPVQADKPIPAIEAPEKVKQPLRASALAALICKEPAFWKWLNEKYHIVVNDEGGAADIVRRSCGIGSRSALDSNENAARAFYDIRDQFLAWKAVG